MDFASIWLILKLTVPFEYDGCDIRMSGYPFTGKIIRMCEYSSHSLEALVRTENRRERVKRALMEMAIQSEFRDRLCWGFAKAGKRRSSLHKKERGVMKVNETASGRLECSRYWFQGTRRLDPYIKGYSIYFVRPSPVKEPITCFNTVLRPNCNESPHFSQDRVGEDTFEMYPR